MMRIRFLLFLSFALCFPTTNLHAQTENTNSGFVSNVIWYSRDPFPAHEQIRVYTLIFNGHNETLRGTVVFKDTGTPIGEYSFSIAGNSAKDISVPWTPEDGKHLVVAHIENAELVAPDGTTRAITLASNTTPASERIAETPILYTETPPAQLIKSAENSVPVQLLSTLLGAGISKGISLLPGQIQENAKTGINTLEEKRNDLVLGLETNAQKNKATPSFESFKNSPLETVALFAATTGIALSNSPLFAYGAATLLLLFLVARLRRWYRGF